MPSGHALFAWRDGERIDRRTKRRLLERLIEKGEALPAVAVDWQRLGVALGNLLDNAITYTPAGGKIALSARRQGDKEITLTVADTGIGIPAQYLPHVFEKFFRVPGQSRGAGTGLGLAIVKEIVAAHRGWASCESAPGKGTAFHLTLPVYTSSLAA